MNGGVEGSSENPSNVEVATDKGLQSDGVENKVEELKANQEATPSDIEASKDTETLPEGEIPEAPKKKKKKKKKSKTAHLPDVGSDLALEKLELNEEPSDEEATYALTRPLAERVEFAINRYRKNHKFTASQKYIFDDYLRFGGIDVGQKAFQGRTTAADHGDVGDEDLEAAQAGNVRVDDLEAEDEDRYISFEEVARLWLGNRFFLESKFISLEQFEQAPKIIKGFLRYLIIRHVAPEYEQDIRKAMAVAERAQMELPACKKTAYRLPGKFNKACSLLYGGDLHGLLDINPSWLGESDTNSAFSVAAFVGMSEEEAKDTVKPYVPEENMGCIESIEAATFRVAGFDPPEPINLENADTVPKAPSMIQLKLKQWQKDTSPNYDVLIEPYIRQDMYEGMVLNLTLRKLSTGFWYMDRITQVLPSFYEDEEFEEFDEE
ncbi:hypothetical protein BZG36_01896 [Bifiguratus adelaidae]|uniref:Argonaute siRNA chaperone complex subunit Arb1 n=1 Tax=Bifiguratus adelaidae TaxID=1938954 RepID=A0A261Y4V4_9FUNG|nr:hypothetical protein BZG36_01896 [Bifiguratus adelaidae]